METAELLAKVEPLKLDPHQLFPKYHIVDSTKKARKHIDRLRKQKKFALDTEYVGRDLVSAQTSNGKDRVCVWAEYLIDDYKSLFNEKDTKLVFHNYQADYFSLLDFGIKIDRHWADTMVMAWLEHTEKFYGYGLEKCFAREFNIKFGEFKKTFGVVPPGKKKEVILDLREVKNIRPDLLAAYGSLDSWKTMRLYHRLRKKLENMDAEGIFKNMWDLYIRQERPFTEVLKRLRERGIGIDVKLLKTIQKKVKADMEKYKTEFRKAVGDDDLNLNSPTQLQNLLYNKLKFPVLKKTKPTDNMKAAGQWEGNPSTDAETLGLLVSKGYKVCSLLLEYKKLSTQDKTFLTGILNGVEIDPEDENRGILRSDFNQLLTTGRISSRSFKDIDGNRVGANLQNIPKREDKDPHIIRRAFVPRKKGNTLAVGDESQLELRVTAHESNSKTMIDAFEKGQDLHSRTAKETFDLDCEVEEVKKKYPLKRDHGKTVNFGIIYGQTEYGLSGQLGISMNEAAELIKKYLDKVDGVRKCIAKTIKKAQKVGYSSTITGRRRYMGNINSPIKGLQEHDKRAAFNNIVQGSASDIIKRAMVEAEFGILGYAGNAHKRLKELKAEMLLQVHDELIFECPPENVEEVKEIMNTLLVDGFKLKVPLVADVNHGENWALAK